MRVSGVYARLVLALAEPSPTPTPGGGGGGPLRPPDFTQGAADAPWISKLGQVSNVVALVLVFMGLLALLAGAGVAALGPRFGFHRAGEIGRGGIIGGLACGALAASGWALINAVVAMFT